MSVLQSRRRHQPQLWQFLLRACRCRRSQRIAEHHLEAPGAVHALPGSEVESALRAALSRVSHRRCGIGVTLLFIVYLIPKLTEMLDSTGGSLPLGRADHSEGQRHLQKDWWMMLMAGVAAFILGKAWLARPESAIPWARFKLRLPLSSAASSRRGFMSSSSKRSGQSHRQRPHHGACDAAHASGHRESASAREFERRDAHVGEGVALSRALDRSGQFPPLLIDMVNVGEQTGDHVRRFLERAAERFDRELSKKIDTLAALIQPLIVCLMASMVGLMAYLMMTTIFQTISSINK
jgi:type II secretory pathway component PulF